MDDKLDKIKDDITDIKVSLSKIESTLERNTERADNEPKPHG